jgi:hypothetical protein
MIFPEGDWIASFAGFFCCAPESPEEFDGFDPPELLEGLE